MEQEKYERVVEISRELDMLNKVVKVLNDPDINEFQYTIEDDEWIVHLK